MNGKFSQTLATVGAYVSIGVSALLDFAVFYAMYLGLDTPPKAAVLSVISFAAAMVLCCVLTVLWGRFSVGMLAKLLIQVLSGLPVTIFVFWIMQFCKLNAPIAKMVSAFCAAAAMVLVKLILSEIELKLLAFLAGPAKEPETEDGEEEILSQKCVEDPKSDNNSGRPPVWETGKED